MSLKSASDPGLPGSGPTKAYWQTPPHDLASRQSPCLPAKASTVIVGSGITGTSIAHHLLDASPDLDIVMLEARSITSGATGRNGGHCKDVPFKTYKKWKTDFGEEAAKRLVRFQSSHIDATRQLATQLRQEGFTDAQFRHVESVTAVFDRAAFRDLRSNMEAWLEDFPDQRSRCAVFGAEEAEKKYGLLGACGVLTLPAAALWPYRLVTTLLERLLRRHRGFSLEAYTPVLSITANEDSPFPYAVHTPRGTITTQRVIHCTNGYASHLLPAFRGNIVPVRGQMTALIPSHAFPRLGHERSWSLYWPNGGFDYMTQASGAEGHVFLGGGVEQASSEGVVDLDCSSDSEINKPALDHLCSVLPRYFKAGEGTKLGQAWTGIMGFTPDGLPVVGKLPRELSSTKLAEGTFDNEWIAAGFNGYGMVHCWQSGRAIADMISGRPNEEIEEYFPKEQFECTPARLKKMNFKTMESEFYKNAPVRAKSHL